MEKKGEIVFDQNGRIEFVNSTALGFLEKHHCEVLDGYLHPLNHADKEAQLNMVKSRFLTTAAHEFRTPLSAVMSSAALAENYLSEGNVERVATHLEKIKRAALQITDVLNDFLSLSKLESGEIKWQPEPFDLCVFCGEIAEEIKGLVEPVQDIIFEPVHTECMVMLDKKLLREVVVNLILNAIKYSQKTVHISCFHSNGMLEIQIRDEGIGIPQEEQKFIFERFFRANNAINIPGTGIGLNLTKKYLEIMNGSIYFVSTEGEGSVFFVKIPTSPS